MLMRKRWERKKEKKRASFVGDSNTIHALFTQTARTDKHTRAIECVCACTQQSNMEISVFTLLCPPQIRFFDLFLRVRRPTSWSPPHSFHATRNKWKNVVDSKENWKWLDDGESGCRIRPESNSLLKNHGNLYVGLCQQLGSVDMSGCTKGTVDAFASSTHTQNNGQRLSLNNTNADMQRSISRFSFGPIRATL